MLRSDNERYWPAAFALIIGNVAFARILTAGMGGGDETTVLKVLLAGQSLWFIRVLGFLLVFLLAFPPLVMVYKRIANNARFWVVVSFCVLPLIIMKLYEFMLLGKVLQAGVLTQTNFLGVADFIYLHTALMAFVVLIFRKTLFAPSSKSLT